METRGVDKLIKEVSGMFAAGQTAEEIAEKFSGANGTVRRVLLLLKILSREKELIFPDKDLYHKILKNTAVTNRADSRYLNKEGKQGRNLLINLNYFFMTFNMKVIAAVCLVVALGGAFVYWRMMPQDPTAVPTIMPESVDLSEYTPATVVAVEDVSAISDSFISESEAEVAALAAEEMDIYLADAEAEALNSLAQLYEAYEL